MDIAGLEDWYADLCNGDWEHTGGIKIETLDNPGWCITVTYDPHEPEPESINWLLEHYSNPEKPIFVKYDREKLTLEVLCEGTHTLADAMRMVLAVKV